MGYGYGKRELSPVKIANFRHGLNTTKRASEVWDLYKARYPRFHCVDCKNLTLHNNKRRSAVAAINYEISGRIYGSHFYRQLDGTEILLQVVGQKLYSQNTTTGVLTEMYDFGGTGEAWFVDWLDKCWITNGKKVVKVEKATAYQVGIAAPATGAAAAASGGSLPDGTYNVYVGYARKVSGSNALFSKGKSLGAVVLSGGNNTIAITTFGNSTDAQVNNKVVWVDDTNTGVYYLYHQTDDNTAVSINISGATGKQTAFTYTVYAAGNEVPGALEYVALHNKRLYGNIKNTLYYSLQEGNVYDLERFGATRIIVYPFDIQGIFSFGEHLYLNTPGGLIRQPYGDPGMQYQRVGANEISPMWFRYPRTVASHGNLLMGVTGKTFGIFDGERWYSNDFSRDVKPDFKRLYAGSGANIMPCGVIVRSDDRLEYHLSFRDRSVDPNMNNTRLVLNLDELKIYDREDFIAPWERWDVGANYFAVNQSNDLYGSQSNTVSVVFKNRTARMQDSNVYIQGKIQTKVPEAMIKTGTIIPAMDAIATFEQARSLAKFAKPFTIRVQVATRNERVGSDTVTPQYGDGGESRFGTAIFGTSTFTSDVDEPRRVKLNNSVKGYAFFVEIKQVEEDARFQLMELELHGYLTRGRMI